MSSVSDCCCRIVLLTVPDASVTNYALRSLVQAYYYVVGWTTAKLYQHERDKTAAISLEYRGSFSIRSNWSKTPGPYHYSAQQWHSQGWPSGAWATLKLLKNVPLSCRAVSAIAFSSIHLSICLLVKRVNSDKGKETSAKILIPYKRPFVYM